MNQAQDNGSASAEPPSPRTSSLKDSLLKRSPFIARVFAVPEYITQRFPLLFGAILLLGVSSLAATAEITPAFADRTGLGGADGAEEVEVDIIFHNGTLYSGEEFFLVGSNPPWFNKSQLTEEVLANQDEGAIVTVAWSPLTPEGASGRGVKTHVVTEGEVLGKIAERNGVSMYSLAYSNNIVDPDSIQPGDKLRIPPVEGVLHVVKKDETLNGITKKYDADKAEILAFNGLPADGSVLNVGDELVVPGGEAPPPPKPKSVPTYSGPSYATNRVRLGNYIAPTTGHNYGRRHSNNGVDIANSCGTPIYAAAAGTVSRSAVGGWNGGYGNVIDINHPNGTSTRYAHNTRNLVGAGEYVAQGQLIAIMGTTGRSTGCHLHFEVHGAINPLVKY